MTRSRPASRTAGWSSRCPARAATPRLRTSSTWWSGPCARRSARWAGSRQESPCAARTRYRTGAASARRRRPSALACWRPARWPVPGTRLSDEAVFQLAATLEGHPDNVAACLAGGLTIAWTPRPEPAGGAPAGAGGPGGASGDPAPGAGAAGALAAGVGPAGARLLRIGVPATLRAVACVPPVPLATEAARQALPRTVPHADAAANAARSALLVAALTGAPDALFDATEDFLHQPYRAAIMPEAASLLGVLRRAGAAAVVSGAGPAVLVLSFDGRWPSAEAVDSIARETGIAWHVIPLHIDRQGAHVQQGGLDVYPPVSARRSPTRDQGPSWNRSEAGRRPHGRTRA